mgnify:CR=1 FL=1
MTNEQKKLLQKLSSIYNELYKECEQDDSFHKIMIENNDLFPLSLDEMALEWLAVAESKRINKNN